MRIGHQVHGGEGVPRRGDVAARMPLLSAYLGHVGPASTYWYLQATPEVLAVAAQWLEQLKGQRS